MQTVRFTFPLFVECGPDVMPAAVRAAEIDGAVEVALFSANQDVPNWSLYIEGTDGQLHALNEHREPDLAARMRAWLLQGASDEARIVRDKLDEAEAFERAEREHEERCAARKPEVA